MDIDDIVFPMPQDFVVLRFAEGFIRENRYGPLVREVAKGTGVSEPQVSRSIRRLAKLGKIIHKPHAYRGIALVEKDTAA